MTTNKTKLEIQIADIFWVFGRRGFTDTETVDDSVRKTVYAITQAMLDALPEGLELDGIKYKETAYVGGFNQAISEMETAIKKIGGSDEL